MIGHEELGSGATRVVVLNDWMCDTSTWDTARPYLDRDRFTWSFADLRGYGRSRGLAGSFNVEESAADVIELADALGYRVFSVVGHSMSSLVALHLAQKSPVRIDRAVTVTPPPPRGFGADEAALIDLQALARGDDAKRTEALRARSGERLSERWTAFKVARWRATSDPEAVAAYAAMFARDGLPDPWTRIDVPVLAVTGGQDDEAMRGDAVKRHLGPLCENLTVTSLADCGHYPMQEAPPLLTTVMQRFLAGRALDAGA